MRHVMLLFAGLALLTLFACTPPKTSTLRVITEPAGGKVLVVEPNFILEHEEETQLFPGQYTLRPHDAPYSPGDVHVDLQAGERREVKVPLGQIPPLEDPIRISLPPESPIPPPLVTILTDPPGAKVQIEETAQEVAHGQEVSLNEGRYTLIPKARGYRPTSTVVHISSEPRQTVTVPLGAGHGWLTVRTDPPGGLLTLEGRPAQQEPLRNIELEPGSYTVKAEKIGYFEMSSVAVVRSGQEVEVIIPLRKIPTHGRVRVNAQPSDADIYFQGRHVGRGRADLGELPFGNYQVRGEKAIDARTRLSGEASIAVREDRNYDVSLVLDRRTALFDGQWLPEAEARNRELERYRSQRTARPVHLEVALSSEAHAEMAGRQNLAEVLHAVLRVGDRATFTDGGQSWTVWKRHGLMTDEFGTEVRTLTQRGSAPWSWPEDPGASKVRLDAGGDVEVAMAFALHGSRSAAPLLFLVQGQAPARGTTIRRVAGDGPLTLVLHGGEDVRDNAGITWVTAGGLRLGHVAAGNTAMELSWSRGPDRLLVTGDLPSPRLAAIPPLEFRPNQKGIVVLIKDVQVTRLDQYTRGPQYAGWRHIVAEPSGLPLDEGLDRGAIGPNSDHGKYHRVWVITYAQDGGQTQRQISATYTVTGEPMSTESNIYIPGPQ